MASDPSVQIAQAAQDLRLALSLALSSSDRLIDLLGPDDPATFARNDPAPPTIETPGPTEASSLAERLAGAAEGLGFADPPNGE